MHGRVDEGHAAQLTREEITASVHYVWFNLSTDQVDRFQREPVVLAVAHEHYDEATPLSDDTKRTLLDDLRS